MGQEIERKFLQNNNQDNTWNKNIGGVEYQQGYIPTDPKVTVRVRIAGTKGYLTIKREPLEGSFSRAEYEYEIPLSDAQEMISTLCKDGVISKTRYKIPYENHIWEIDVFHGDNEGLIVAEVELLSEDEQVIFPPWIGKEVTHDPRYANSALSKIPFKKWQ